MANHNPDRLHFARGGASEFFQQGGLDTANCFFPLTIFCFNYECRPFKRGWGANTGQPVSNELWPGSLETGNYPFAVFGRPAVNRKEHPKQILQPIAPDKEQQ